MCDAVSCEESDGLYFTPSQRVGRNPEVPGDLLNEPINVVSGTASIQDAAVAKAQSVRLTARKAVLALQDDRTRVVRCWPDHVVIAYWRDQKWSQGVLSQGGKWYGSGVVIGLIGRNVIVAHRKHIIRCAPEQVPAATSEEKFLIETPGTELLGIKDMIESGIFRSSQYVDFLAQSYPPQEESVVQGLSGESPAVSSDVKSSSHASSQSVEPEVAVTGEAEPTVFEDQPMITNEQSSGSDGQTVSAEQPPAEPLPMVPCVGPESQQRAAH